jgi:transglutaminase-like putative cysteine protease
VPNNSTGTEADVLANSNAAIPISVTVVASGKNVKSNDVAIIDYSNTEDGYVMVRSTVDSAKRLKVRVKGPKTTYTYNLTPKQWAAFPLSDENGNYQITVYRNVEGNSYASVLSLKVNVTMEDEFAPFIRSNQYVDFDHAPKTVAQAASLTGGMSDPLKKVEAIYNFVVNGMKYDKELAANVTSGYVPNLDAVLSKMSGICFDYAALMTGMLRSQGVPTKLVVGYAGDAYHAWINVYSEDTGWIDGVIYFDGAKWMRMDPTFAANGGSDIMDYIGNGTNYSGKYFY